MEVFRMEQSHFLGDPFRLIEMLKCFLKVSLLLVDASEIVVEDNL